jgi:N-acetylmuramoyl-L-alanine amidase
MAISARIFVNPGHGPYSGGRYDPGAVGPTGKREAEQVLKVGEYVAAYLKSAGHVVLLFQDGDPAIKPVTDTCNSWNADYFVSIHRNAAATGAAWGIETYSLTAAGKGRDLAMAVQDCLLKAFPQSPNRGVKTANFYVLRKTSCPAILTEVGFISNPLEERWFESETQTVEAARAIADGLLRVIGRGEDLSEVKTLVLWSGDGDQAAAQILAWKKGAYVASVASYKAGPAPAGEIYVVGGSYAPEGAVLLTGANRTETAAAVLRELEK